MVGGGDSALQEALTLAEQASRITVVHRGAALTAQKAYRDAVAAQSRIELCDESEVEEILAMLRSRACASEMARRSPPRVSSSISDSARTARSRDFAVLDNAGAILTDASMRSAFRALRRRARCARVGPAAQRRRRRRRSGGNCDRPLFVRRALGEV